MPDDLTIVSALPYKACIIWKEIANVLRSKSSGEQINIIFLVHILSQLHFRPVFINPSLPQKKSTCFLLMKSV